MNREMIDELKSTTAELLKLVTAFSREQLNVVQVEGSWTAAQVAEHMNKSYTVAEVLNGPVKQTDRNPAEKVNQIKEVLLNFELKMKSPEFILPENKQYDKTLLLDSLSTGIKKITAAAGTLNLEETCTALALPQPGELTRLEWISFIIYHTQRHNHQLKNIADKVRHNQ